MKSNDSCKSELTINTESKHFGLKTCENAGKLINQDDISQIQKDQKKMLTQLEKINQTLLGCNDIAEEQYVKLLSNFQKHTAVLIDMKKNLHYLHTHIRKLKTTLNEKYPETKRGIETKKSVNVTSMIGLESSKTE